MTYSSSDIRDAIDRLAKDVDRRSTHSEGHATELAPLLTGLEALVSLQAAGDRQAAAQTAREIAAGLEAYRPTNASSRSKAVLLEVIATIIADDDAAAPSA